MSRVAAPVIGAMKRKKPSGKTKITELKNFIIKYNKRMMKSKSSKYDYDYDSASPKRKRTSKAGASMKSSASADSVIYVSTSYPNHSVIDLTKSDASILPPKASVNKQRTKCKPRRKQTNLQHKLSIITIQPYNCLACTSSQDFGLIRTQNNIILNTNYYNVYNPSTVQKDELYDTQSTFKLKHSHHMSSIFDDSVSDSSLKRDFLLKHNLVPIENVKQYSKKGNILRHSNFVHNPKYFPNKHCAQTGVSNVWANNASFSDYFSLKPNINEPKTNKISDFGTDLRREPKANVTKTTSSLTNIRLDALSLKEFNIDDSTNLSKMGSISQINIDRLMNLYDVNADDKFDEIWGRRL